MSEVVQRTAPNILIILTDQQSSWSIGAYGATRLTTPHLDRIAAEGARLTNYFTNAAVCTPSRGCLFTGLYPHQHGAFMNDMALNRNVRTSAQILQDNGYDTGYIGKWHLDGTRSRLESTFSIIGQPMEDFGIDRPAHERTGLCVPPERSMGFADCQYMFECSHGKKVIEQDDGTFEISDREIGDEKSYTTDWLTDKAESFIRRDRDKPWFLVLSIPDPHNPFSVRAPYNTKYNPADMDVPRTFYQEKPAWLRNRNKNASQWSSLSGGMTEENLQNAKAQYFGEVSCIDDNTGKLMQVLDDQGILDQTLIIFSTDHGEYMGDHGIMYKNQLYETAYHIPMMLRWPTKIKPGTVVKEYISTVDFQQTLLGLLEIEPCGKEQGHDASPLICGRSIPWTDEVYIYSTLKDKAGIFTPEHQLAYVKQNCDNLLFDRACDPLQEKNLFSNPECLSIRQSLKNKLLSHNIKIGAPEAEWLKLDQY